MSENNGRHTTEVEEPRLFDPALPVPTSPASNAWRWWFGAMLISQLLIGLNYHHTNSMTRHDLEENSKLIKQLQERIIVKDLANLRKGTP